MNKTLNSKPLLKKMNCFFNIGYIIGVKVAGRGGKWSIINQLGISIRTKN